MAVALLRSCDSRARPQLTNISVDFLTCPHGVFLLLQRSRDFLLPNLWPFLPN